MQLSKSNQTTAETASVVFYHQPESPVHVMLVMVEVSGLEPLTPCVQGRCSPN